MEGNVIPFVTEAPDLDAMDSQALREHLEVLRAQVQALDRKEPRNMESEAYEQWADAHEALEDEIDEVLDRLED